MKHHSKLKTENLTNILTLKLKNGQKIPFFSGGYIKNGKKTEFLDVS